jgi:hypothetical protein
VATDDATPFELVRPLASVTSKIRAHAVLADGRELTEDRLLPACPPG